jgi:hypothetical protein
MSSRPTQRQSTQTRSFVSTREVSLLEWERDCCNICHHRLRAFQRWRNAEVRRTSRAGIVANARSKEAQGTILSLWLLRRLLTAYGVSQGPGPELTTTCKVIFVLISISALRCRVFVIGPFAFQRITQCSRKHIETYSRSCRPALGRLPKSKWADFGAAWRYHRAAA